MAEWPNWLRVLIEVPSLRPECGCGGRVHRHGVRKVELVDLPIFGRPARLVWRKQRWRCTGCGRYWSDDNGDTATSRCVLTTRAARWSTLQVGRHGRAVTEVAGDLGCGWHTVMDAVVAVGEQLIDHPSRIGEVSALGLDETLFARVGRFRHQLWPTQIVDVRQGRLLDVVAGRNDAEPCRWLAGRDEAWRDQIEWATLDLSASYRTVFDTMLPTATQVADPFHVVQLANRALDECRRRVQTETMGHRGRRDDPLYRARRRLTIARQRLSVVSTRPAHGSAASWWSPPGGVVRVEREEVVRQIYDHTDPELAVEWVDEIGRDFTDREMPVEVRPLGRTITRWSPQICAWHRSHVSNGPTEAVNNLAKRIKRVAFGLTNFRHHRVRCLLYAGRPDWTLVPTIQP